MAFNQNLPVLVTLARLPSGLPGEDRKALRARLKGDEAKMLADLLERGTDAASAELAEKVRAIRELAGVR